MLNTPLFIGYITANGILELSSLSSLTSLGLVINGIEASDNAGWSVSSAGDINW
ncbi:MAG: hypothetical protein AB8V23_03975 [Candidatus Midichloria sp.]